MLLLLYAIIHCLAAYVLHLVCMIFGTAIPTLSNILMKMFYSCNILAFAICYPSQHSIQLHKLLLRKAKRLLITLRLVLIAGI